MTAPLSTALDGTLERHADGWRWRDGTPEPRVRDMTLADIGPNFRCAHHAWRGQHCACVEIPARWRVDARYWPSRRIDMQAAAQIDSLLREAGERAPIYLEGLAEALDDHRLTGDGWIVSAAMWDAVMREPCGVWWDTEHEADIYARVLALGGTPPGPSHPQAAEAGRPVQRAWCPRCECEVDTIDDGETCAVCKLVL